MTSNHEIAVGADALSIDACLQKAISHHRMGQLHEAEYLYRAILLSCPGHPDANHNLGMIALQTKQATVGLPHFKAALEANPNHGQYWLSYIEALMQAGEYEMARQVLALGREKGLQGEAVDVLVARLAGFSSMAASPETSSQPLRHAQPVASAPAVSAHGGDVQHPEGNLAKAARIPKGMAASRSTVPSDQEARMLVSLFTSGKYAEAMALAHSLTVRFPRHGLGWKASGTLLQKLGRSADALAPLQTAAVLMPQDVEVFNNLGSVLQDLGRLDEAVTSYRRALKLRPDFADAHYNLGSVLKNIGQLKNAVASFRRALAIRPDFSGAHNNLGNTLKELGQLDEAMVSYRRALETKPDSAEIHNNLGNVLHDLGQADEAMASYRRALECKPDYAEAHKNLGNVLQDIGQLGDAAACYRRALEIKPDYAGAYSHLGHVLWSMDCRSQAALAYQKAWEFDPVNEGLDAAIYSAVLCYLDGNIEQCRIRLLAAKPVMMKADPKHKNTRAYWHHLNMLLALDERQGLYPRANGNMEKLYVIGESHSLSAHGVVVNYQGHEMRCAAEWIVGCKQWHLANGRRNKYKYQIEAIMARLPRESVILLTIGEIDCRLDEGIIKAWKKSQDAELYQIVRATVEPYIDYVVMLGRRHEHKLIVSGVPCTNQPLIGLDVADVECLVYVIRTFNELLRTLALESGMDFLDVHKLTDRGDGIANGEWHIDEIHLLPSALEEAFAKLCLYS